MKPCRLSVLLTPAFLALLLSGCVFGSNPEYFEKTSTGPDSSVPKPSPVAGKSPVASDDGPFEIAQNQILNLDTSQLLANDSDPRGLALRFHAFQVPAKGTLNLNGSTLTFRPEQDFIGTVAFQYEIANSEDLTAVATVIINVRKAATEVMYGQSSSTLYRYDPHTLTSTAIANFKKSDGTPISVFDIAITSNGLMYGVDGASLYYIDALTGVMTEIFKNTTTFGNVNGLTALSDGRLVLSGNGVALFNISTQQLTTLVAPGIYQSSGDIIALPNGFLYLSATGTVDDHLIKIDPNTGATFDMGSLGHTQVYGLGYAYSNFYGFSADGSVFQINQNNATTTNVSSTGVQWYGATTNPVLW